MRDLKPPLGVRAIPGVETEDGFDFDFAKDRIMLDTQTPMGTLVNSAFASRSSPNVSDFGSNFSTRPVRYAISPRWIEGRGRNTGWPVVDQRQQGHRVWEVATGRLVRTIVPDEVPERVMILLRVTGDSKTVFAMTQTAIEEYSIATSKLIFRVKGAFGSFDVSRDGKTVAVGNRANKPFCASSGPRVRSPAPARGAAREASLSLAPPRPHDAKPIRREHTIDAESSNHHPVQKKISRDCQAQTEQR